MIRILCWIFGHDSIVLYSRPKEMVPNFGYTNQNLKIVYKTICKKCKKTSEEVILFEKGR